MASPAYRAYTVIKREGKDDFWLNLGVAFAHEDGEGFNILLQALPTDAKTGPSNLQGETGGAGESHQGQV